MKEFFQNLSIRLNSENDMSDITWALCNSSMSFRKVFLDYCFDCAISQEIDTIEREFSEKSLRPDFLITDIDGKRYLLEVKKYDPNLHEEYKDIEKIEECAIIANYHIRKQDTKKTYAHSKTWHGFIECLTKAKLDNNGLNTQLINGYLEYLISVTNYFKGETMNLTNLCSLHVLLETINDIAKQSLIKKFGLEEKEIKIKYDCCQIWSGIDIKFKKNKNYFHVWCGVTYDNVNNKRVYLFLEFFDDCSPNIKKLLDDMDKSKYFKKPYQEDESRLVEIENKYFKKLTDNEQKYDDQKSDLKGYFEDVFNTLIPS